MEAILTGPQLRIVQGAALFFDNALAGSEVRSMFRGCGDDISVGLAYSECGHHFIVRQTIPDFASSELITMICTRLMSLMADSIDKVVDGLAR